MIHLDSNLLIAMADASDPRRAAALELIATGQPAAVSSLAWWEFVCGPVSPEGALMVRRLLAGGIIAFTEEHSRKAASLFNAAGRARRLRFDSLIAATAVLADAEFATANSDDFAAFVPLGLKLRVVG